MSWFRELPEMAELSDVPVAERYRLAPADDLVMVLDVVGSTRAVEAGRYKEVNALGVACIVGVLNALGTDDVPYVFGGDGATLLIPAAGEAAAAEAAQGLIRLGRSAFDLELRAGMVPVRALREAGHELWVSRLRLSSQASLAVFAGDAVPAADDWVKDPEGGRRWRLVASAGDVADCAGFECRWRPLPALRGEVVAVLVQALGASEEARRRTYARAVAALLDIVGDLERCRPVSAANVELSPLVADMTAEAAIRTGSKGTLAHRLYALRAAAENRLGRLLVRLGWRVGDFDGATYPAEAARNSDFRKFDGVLRGVLDLTPAEHGDLRDRLETMRADGALAYGTHASDAALMTCMVRSRAAGHLHFIDGAGGGYTLAAKELKAQLAAR